MGGALRKTMVYLGLAEDDARYESWEGEDEADEQAEDDVSDEPFNDRRQLVREPERRAAVTPISRGHIARVVPTPAGAELHRITTIHPRTYNEAKTIGEAFREGTPVIMNLTDLDDADAKRLVDFAAGLVFGLHGAIERVTSKVFLLSPAHIEVVAEDKEPASAPGFFNQS